jgi:hypothetical protein
MAVVCFTMEQVKSIPKNLGILMPSPLTFRKSLHHDLFLT